MAAIPQEITQLLLTWREGDTAALDQLVPIVYPELRRIARRYMGRENSRHTLQTSALINEAYVRLLDQQGIEWQNRGHFYAVAARVMRHILVDHARKRLFAKRGAGAAHVVLDEVAISVQERSAEFIALDEALKGLFKIDQRKGRIVEMRFFGGLTVDETANFLNLSPITVKREWRAARAWLFREISGKGN